MGGLACGWIAVATLWAAPRHPAIARVAAQTTVWILCGLAPWIYVVLRFRSQLKIGDADLSWYLTSLDWIGTRLSPVPTMGYDASSVSTPNLDAQINAPLLASVVVLGTLAFWARLRTPRVNRIMVAAGTTALAAALVCWASTDPRCSAFLPRALRVIQFPYRLVACVSLLILVAQAGVLEALAASGRLGRSTLNVLGCAAVVAGVGLGLKVPRCLEGGSPDREVKSYVDPPRGDQYGSADYATPGAYKGRPPAEVHGSFLLRVGTGAAFGVPAAATVTTETKTWVVTNIQAFPWNHITIDGQPRSLEDQFVHDTSLGTVVDAGTHQLGYVFQPDRTWLMLRWLSALVTAAWALWLAAGVFRRSILALQPPWAARLLRLRKT